MKKFLSGFLAGAIIFSMVGVFAVSYVARPVDFKVLVNGKEFVSDPPALEVEGRTYLPLRAMGDVLGVPVNWNEELRQAEVGNSAPVASKNEYSRTNPAPINTVQTYVQEGFGELDTTVSIKVNETIRGNDAWEKIKAYNKHTSPAPKGYEYILANVETSVLYTASDRSIEIDPSKFECFSSTYEKYEDVYVSIDNELNEIMYEGGTANGYIVFCVKEDDINPTIAFCRDYDGTGGIWFALK